MEKLSERFRTDLESYGNKFADVNLSASSLDLETNNVW